MADTPGPVQRLFHASLLILGAMLALGWAVGILRCIWPWLVGGTVVVAGVSVLVWWLRRRNRW